MNQKLISWMSLGAYFTMLAQSAAAAPEKNSKTPYNANVEITQLFFGQIIAYQPSLFGYETFAAKLGLKALSGPGRELFRGAKGVKEWPSISREGTGLRFEDKNGHSALLEVTDLEKHAFSINGKAFTPLSDRPLLPQIRQALEMNKSGSTQLWNWILPSAEASQDHGTSFLVTLGSAVAGGLATIAAGASAGAIAAAGVGAVAAGSVVCGLAIEGEYKGLSAGTKYMNCMTKPLSLVGSNPRDRLYLDKIACPGEAQLSKSSDSIYPGHEISVSVKSTTGREETRTFGTDDQGLLRSVSILDEDSQTSANIRSQDGKRFAFGSTTAKGVSVKGVLSRPGNDKQLDDAQSLFANFDYYQRLCANPELKRAALHRASVDRGNAEDRAFDAATPDDLNNSAR